MEQKNRNKRIQKLKDYHIKLKQGLITRAKTLNPIEKSKLNPHSLRFAINAKCFDCSGFIKIDVTYCDMPNCELNHIRPWQRPHLKTQIKRIDTVLSKSSAIKTYSCSDNKIPQEQLNSNGKLHTPYARLKANPKSLRAAINAYCFWCSCEQRKEVRLCPAGNCPLHNFRPWQPKIKCQGVLKNDQEKR